MSTGYTDGASGAVGGLPGDHGECSGAGGEGALTERPDGVCGMVVMSYGCTTGAGLIPHSQLSESAPRLIGDFRRSKG